MFSPQQKRASEADHVANRICRRRLMNASLAMATAWLTYVNPFTLQVRDDAPWPWLAAVICISAAAVGYALWSVTKGDRRAWMRAFESATRKHAEAAPQESV